MPIAGRSRLLIASSAVAVVFVLLAVAYAARAAILQSLVQSIASSSSGYDVRFGHFALSGSHVDIQAAVVKTRGGDPVLTAEHVTAEVSIAELMRGTRQYGLRSLIVDGPHVTIVRHRDGTYNIPLPRAAVTTTTPTRAAAPYDLTIAVRRGSVELIDEAAIYRGSQHQTIDDFNANAYVRSNARTTYDVRFALAGSGGRFPVHGAAIVDDLRGSESHHWTSAVVPIGPLVDYAVNSTAIHLTAGLLRDVDLRYFGLLNRRGQIERHLGARARLDGAQVYVAALRRPLRDVHGPVRVYDDGLVTPRADATLAGLPVRIAGGLFDFSRPSFRLGIIGAGPLETLVTLGPPSPYVHRLAGPLTFSVRLESLVEHPVVFAHFNGAHISYNGFPARDVHGLVTIDGTELDIINAGGDYAGIGIETQALIALEKHLGIRAVVRADAPAHTLPYVDALVPGMPVGAIAVIAGIDTSLGAHGIAAGANRGDTLESPIAIDQHGNGLIGPLLITHADGSSLYARATLEQNPNGLTAIVDARRFHLAESSITTLPGIVFPPIPRLDGAIDGVIGVATNKGAVALGGIATLSGAHVMGVAVDRAAARFDGSASDIRVAALDARGPWGSFSGTGGSNGTRTALDGRFRGSLDSLASVGVRVPAHGTIDAPVSILADGPTTVVQTRDARFGDASIDGIALDHVDATVGVRGSQVSVYSARGDVGGGNVVAAGRFGNGGTLGVTTSAIRNPNDPRVPVTSGTVRLLASIGGTLAAPSADASAIVAGGLIAGDIPVGGDFALAYARSRLGLDGSLLRFGDAYATLDGSIGGISPSMFAPRYDLHSRVRAADFGDLASTLDVPLPYLVGSLDANLNVRGAGNAPQIVGDVAVPEGAVNGLAFKHGFVRLNADAFATRASGGNVTVGTTHLAFGGSYAKGATRATVRSPHVDLTDFNDYFDLADTLAGTGPLAIDVLSVGDTLATSGDLRISGARFRRFALGDARARWFMRGRSIQTDLAVNGTAGSFALNGAILPAAHAPLIDPIKRSTLDLHARANAVDLATWLPAFGLHSPLVGRADIQASVRGRYPRLSLATTGSLTGGRFDRIAIQQFTIAATAQNGRATITDAHLVAPSLDVRATGNLGFLSTDRVALTASLSSPDVGLLYTAATGAAAPFSGSLTTGFRIGGSLRTPAVDGTLDANAVRIAKVSIPHAHAELRYAQQLVTLQSSEIDFIGGKILADGRVPVTLAPIGVAPNAPIDATFRTIGLNLTDFAPLLPTGTRTGGIVDSRVTVTGTATQPQLGGTIALHNGSYRSDFERADLTNIGAHIVLGGTQATLIDFHTDVGGGAIDATGNARVSDLRDPLRTLAYTTNAQAHAAGLDFPAYFRGKIDGSLAIIRAANARPLVSGDLAFNTTRIPLTAIYNPNASAATTPAVLPDIAFDLGITAGSDDRVQSGAVDIGATGAARLGGTLAQPTLDGRFTSTGGTLSFYRQFVLERGAVLFTPDAGIIPTVFAIATTHVPDPSTDITLTLTGPATSLNLAFDSTPGYDKAQILGLLVNAQALGAIGGIASSNTSNLPSPIASAAFGYVEGQFARSVLSPLGSGLGKALGLSNLNLGYGLTGGFTASASRRLGKNLELVVGESLGYPKRESFGIRSSFNRDTSVQLTFFSSQGNATFGSFSQSYLQSLNSNQTLRAIEPPTSGSGFVFTLQKRYK